MPNATDVRSARCKYARVLYDTWQMAESAYHRQNQWTRHLRHIGDEKTAEIAERWRNEWMEQTRNARDRYERFSDALDNER